MAANTHRSLFPISDLRIYTLYLDAEIENFRSHIKRRLCDRRHSWCGLELQERSEWRAMDPDMRWSFSNTTLCVYTVSPYTLLFGVQLRLTTKLTNLMIGC